jgi:hypothetical protein
MRTRGIGKRFGGFNAGFSDLFLPFFFTFKNAILAFALTFAGRISRGYICHGNNSSLYVHFMKNGTAFVGLSDFH